MFAYCAAHHQFASPKTIISAGTSIVLITIVSIYGREREREDREETESGRKRQDSERIE